VATEVAAPRGDIDAEIRRLQERNAQMKVANQKLQAQKDQLETDIARLASVCIREPPVSCCGLTDWCTGKCGHDQTARRDEETDYGSEYRRGT